MAISRRDALKFTTAIAASTAILGCESKAKAQYD